METSFVEEQNVSISNCSPVELRSIEQVVADDKHEANECEHFTIRGYVAEVRKKDTKICWPFLMLHNHTPGEDAELLPPLSVTKFRRWNCQNCLDKVVSSGPVVVNGAVMDTPNNEVKSSNCLLLQNANVASHPNATKLFHGFSHLNERNVLEGRLNDTSSCVGVCNCEHHPSLCCFKERNESAIVASLTKEGLQIHRDEQGMSEEDQKQPHYSAFTTTEGEAYTIEDKGERNAVISVNTFQTSHGEDDPDMVSAKKLEMKSICGIVDAEKSGVLTSKRTDIATSGHEDDQGVRRVGKMKEQFDIPSGKYGMPVEGDHDLPKDDYVTSIAAHISDHDSISMVDSQEVSDIDINSVGKMARNQSNPRTIYGKLKHKRVRKVRLLNDIMRNQEFRVSSKVHIVEGDAEHNESDSKKMTDASEGEAQTAKQDSRFVNRKTEVNPIKRKNRNDTLQNDDSKHSLMYWLKKKTKKTVTKKRDLQTYTVDCSVRLSEASADTLAGKDLGKWHKQETIRGEKNMLPQVKAKRPCLLLQQDSNTEKGYAPENSTNGNLQQRPVHSSGNVIINKIRNHDLKIQDLNHQKDTQSKKKKKVHEIDDGRLHQMHLPKLQGKVTKKRRTMRICDKGAADDIPMDIVELLANNLHERRLMDAEHSKQSMGHLAHMTDNTKDGCVMDVAKCHGNKLADALYKERTPKMSQLDYKRNDVSFTGKCHENAYCRPKAYPSSSIGNQDSWTDSSKHEFICSSARLHGFSQSNRFPMSGTELPVIGPYGGYSSPQNFCWDRMKIQPLGSHYTDQLISDQNAVSKMHDATSLLLNQAMPGINGQNIGSNFNHGYMDSNSKFRERDMKTVVHKTDWWRSSKPPDEQLPDSKWTYKSSINRGIYATDTSFLEARSGCHSKVTGPADLYTSGNMPASNLLRLMNQAVPPGGFYHTSSNMNRTGVIQESDLHSTDRCTELLGSGVGVRSTETINHPPTIGNPGQDVPPDGFYPACSNLNRIGLMQESELYLTDRCTELLGSGVGVRRTETINHPPAVGNPGQGVLQGFSCKPVRPLPRIGILGSFLQKEISNHSDSCRRRSCFKEGYSTPVTSLDIIGKEKLMASCSTTRSRIPCAQTSISIDESSRCVVPCVASISHPECFETTGVTGQIGFRNEDGSVHPPRGSYSTEVCITNRNPADFTMPDEDSVYMRGGEDPKPEYLLASGIHKHSAYVEKLKQPKLKKLTALEWLMRKG